ncbi:MAG TPA: hypothetical protein PK089_07905 [Methanoregulaceae archaeon]|nr:hypothetical protein [Methanoregulaceae archaeon]HQJ88666.1 hypothetical protein [Methanoregulaceae archaeon]
MHSSRRERFEWAELIDQVPVPAYALDLGGRVVSWNEPLSRLVGIDGAEMIGRGGGVHAVPFVAKPGPMLADLVLAPGLAVPGYLVGLEHDRLTSSALLLADALQTGRCLEVHASPIVVAGERVGAIELVIPPGPQEERIRSSSAIFDRLMRSVRHAILNQLTIVLGYIELAREGMENPVANADLDRAVAAAETIRIQAELTRDFSGIGVREPVERPLADLVFTAVEHAGYPGVSMEARLAPLVVRADPLLIRAIEHLVRLSSEVEPAATVIRFETVDSDPVVLRYGDDSEDGRWTLDANGHPSSLPPEFFLIRDVLLLDGIHLEFTGDSDWAVEVHLPRAVLAPHRKEE